MRINEEGDWCASTLGEYRDMCANLFGPLSSATIWLDEKIEAQGRDQVVRAPDSQMLYLIWRYLMSEDQPDRDDYPALPRMDERF